MPWNEGQRTEERRKKRDCEGADGDGQQAGNNKTRRHRRQSSRRVMLSSFIGHHLLREGTVY